MTSCENQQYSSRSIPTTPSTWYRSVLFLFSHVIACWSLSCMPVPWHSVNVSRERHDCLPFTLHAKFRTGIFRPGIAFTIWTNQFHLLKNGHRQGVYNRILKGRAQRPGPAPHPLYATFHRKSSPSVYALLTNDTPSSYYFKGVHPFNCCKCTVF